MFKTIEWKNNQVILIDQRLLPHKEEYVTCKTYQEIGQAIKNMVIRGAPAIGVAAAMGVALGAQIIKTNNFDSFFAEIENICNHLIKTRPTAVNLAWGLKQMKSYAQDQKDKDIGKLKEGLIDQAKQICVQDVELNRKIGAHGMTLINDNDRILTHCNAGALATAGYGTALGVIYAANEAGKKIEVFADETRPFLQGARLTAWELKKNGIKVTLITDNMAGWLMKNGEITKVIVGADRIAANGDVANKIGTYSVAVLANRHDIPFYVAAPLSTIDLDCPHGDEISIEERDASEVTHVQGVHIAPDGVMVRNPAFDVTPNELVSGIITEKGIAKAPFNNSLRNLFNLE